MDYRLHEEDFNETPEPRVITYCDHCGFAIYSTDDARMVNGCGDIIHSDCWEEYAAEHMFSFTQKITDTDCFCRVN